MKFLILALILVGFRAQAAWAYQDAGLVCLPPSQSVIKGGINPWPFGREMSFPWGGIQGVWQASNSGCSSLFLFKVGNEIDDGSRYMTIIQYDPKECREIARGVGYESNRVVRAVLAGDNGSFEMTIHAFRTADVKTRYGTFGDLTPQESVVVMRMRDLSSNSSQKADFKMERLKKNTVMLCQ